MTASKRTVGREEWTIARTQLLEKEKAFTRERDALSVARRDLPRVRVDAPYVFEESTGRRTLLDLFEDKSQLALYHFMFDPSWQEGCKSCSLLADGFSHTLVHLAARDTAFAVVSRAPFATIAAFRERMGWTFRWLSSAGSDFNYDYGVSFRPEDVAAKTARYNYAPSSFSGSEAPGLSMFSREGGEVFHTYSTYGRGLDIFIGSYNILDHTPLGRQEEDLPYGMAWVRHHDRYGAV